MTTTRFLACILATAAMAACSSDDKTTNTLDGGGDTDAGSGGVTGSGGQGGAATGGKGGGNGGNGGGGTTGTGGSTPGDGGDAGPTTVTFNGTVVAAAPGQLGKEAPLAGVSVCVVDATGKKVATIPCATSDAGGKYALGGLEPTQQIIISFEKTGYGKQIIAADIGTTDITRTDMRMAAPIDFDGGADAGSNPSFGWDPAVVFDASKGYFNTFAVQAAASADAGTAAPGFDFATGVSFAVSPASGVGPFYIDADEKWVPSATSTAGGYGAWFLNLAPGTYTVTATSPTMTCSSAGGNGYGWPQTDGTAKVPIIAGLNTQSIGFFCTPKSTDAGAD